MVKSGFFPASLILSARKFAVPKFLGGVASLVRLSIFLSFDVSPSVLEEGGVRA